MRRSRTLIVAALVVLSAVGCGNEEKEDVLLRIDVDTAGPSIVTNLLVTEDGRGRCDRTDLEPFDEALMRNAREFERRIEALPGTDIVFEGPPNQTIYRAQGRDGRMTWAAGIRDAPSALRGATRLAEDLLDELCGGGDYGGGAD